MGFGGFACGVLHAAVIGEWILGTCGGQKKAWAGGGDMGSGGLGVRRMQGATNDCWARYDQAEWERAVPSTRLLTMRVWFRRRFFRLISASCLCLGRHETCLVDGVARSVELAAIAILLSVLTVHPSFIV